MIAEGGKSLAMNLEFSTDYRTRNMVRMQYHTRLGGLDDLDRDERPSITEIVRALEAALQCQLTRKSDVYAFGVLFELLCRKRAVDTILDEKQSVLAIQACLHGDPEQRPTMAEVLVSLESVLTLQEKFNNSLQPTSKPARRKIFDRIFGGKHSLSSGPPSSYSNIDNSTLDLHDHSL
ncbi:receptor-like protein kinase FERONIA [Tanacetum coccineum]